MPITHKRGALSTKEMNYIRDNCRHMSGDEIAKVLNRHAGPILRYIEKENLRGRDLSEAEYLIQELRHRYYYKELARQFSDTEIKFFENQWIDFFSQFQEDVTHTEEMQIIEVIRTEILINRSMRDRQKNMENIKLVEELVEAERQKPPGAMDPQLISTLLQQLGSLIGAKSAYINEHEKLLAKKERYLKDLKGTREQRKKVADDAKTNFVTWLRQLDTMEAKSREGFEMEVHALAADKERKRLGELHEYQDGEVDQPLLNSQNLIVEGDES